MRIQDKPIAYDFCEPSNKLDLFARCNSMGDTINKNWQIKCLKNFGYFTIYKDDKKVRKFKRFHKWKEYRLFRFSQYFRKGIQSKPYFFTTYQEALKECKCLNKIKGE